MTRSGCGDLDRVLVDAGEGVASLRHECEGDPLGAPGRNSPWDAWTLTSTVCRRPSHVGVKTPFPTVDWPCAAFV